MGFAGVKNLTKGEIRFFILYTRDWQPFMCKIKDCLLPFGARGQVEAAPQGGKTAELLVDDTFFSSKANRARGWVLWLLVVALLPCAGNSSVKWPRAPSRKSPCVSATTVSL